MKWSLEGKGTWFRILALVDYGLTWLECMISGWMGRIWYLWEEISVGAGGSCANVLMCRAMNTKPARNRYVYYCCLDADKSLALVNLSNAAPSLFYRQCANITPRLSRQLGRRHEVITAVVRWYLFAASLFSSKPLWNFGLGLKTWTGITH